MNIKTFRKKKNKKIQICNKIFIDNYTTQNNKIQKKYKPKLNKVIQSNLNLNQTLNQINTIEEDDSNSNDSFENFCMRTARNKWRNNKQINSKKEETSKEIKKEGKENEGEINNLKVSLALERKNSKNSNNLYELLEIKDNLHIYRYSNNQRKNPHKLIYQYFYDDFNKKDYEKAHIILFIGKTGDGKSTAINALFNIIKGIKLEDNHRFILIKEPKKAKGQAESQTDGLHLYYIKDYLNNPIIIIDSQGFGDTRGKEYDELIKKAFEYAFTNIIKHVNSIFFIAKSTDCRLDISTKYIFSCVTSLFSEDICENLIFLTTFANKSTMYEGPAFIKSISSNDKFISILKKTSKKWYYVVESVNILDNDTDKLTLYSFEQMNDLYNEKIKNSQKKSIKKSCEVINKRNIIQTKVKNIISIYHRILEEKNKIQEVDKKINEQDNKLKDIKYQISNKQLEIDGIYIPDKDFSLSLIKTSRDSMIRILDNEYEENTVRRLRYDGGDHTYCNSCKRNCHEYCRCVGRLVERCTIFPIFGNECEVCGHYKSSHTLHSGSKWVDEIERNKVNNYSKIQAEHDKYWEKYNEINDEYNDKMNQKNNKENELNQLNNEKFRIESEKNKYINDKNNLNYNIKMIVSEIKSNILDLMKISQTLNNIAMNKFHYEIENEYIQFLIDNLQEVAGAKLSVIKGLKDSQKYNNIFLEISKMTDEELMLSNEEDFLNKINKIVYNKE